MDCHMHGMDLRQVPYVCMYICTIHLVHLYVGKGSSKAVSNERLLQIPLSIHVTLFYDQSNYACTHRHYESWHQPNFDRHPSVSSR